MKLLVVLLFTFLGINLVELNTNGSFYLRSNGLDDWTFPDYLLTISTRQSPTQCAFECVQIPTCRLFFVHTSSGQCRYHSQMYDQTWSGSTSQGWMAYTVINTDGIPLSCADLPSYGFFQDGEYLIYPFPTTPTLGVPVYCHDLMGSAKEYITLKHENYFQGKDNIGCNATHNRETIFSKIRFDFQSMTVVTDDFTFASRVGEGVPYGTVEDCTAYEVDVCHRPSMSLNLRGTGFKLHTIMVWAAFGYRTEMLISQSADDKEVNMICKGYCVHCRPQFAFLALVYTGDDVGSSSSSG